MAAKKKVNIDPELVEAIWAAGVISSGGSLKLVHAAQTRVVRYVITSSLLPTAIDRLAVFSGMTVHELTQSNATRTSKRVAAQGAALHSLMTRIWPYLTRERQAEYAELRKQITSTTEGPNPYRDDTPIENYKETK